MYQPYKVFNDNNNYVNLQHVTNLGLYNKLILVTQEQVLELYITVIEHKTLYGLNVPHTAFPKCNQSNHKRNNNATTNEVHVTKDRGIRTCHKIGGEVLDNRFPSNHKGKLMTRRKEDLTTFNSSENRKN